MKVYIGPYKDWIGPYQIADMVFFWLDSWPPEGLEDRWDYRLHDKFGDWLASTWVNKFCEWVHKKRPQTIKVRIDKYDTWGMDHTLAPIILPMLKQLHETKHGAPWVDDEDVPEELRSTNAPPLTEEQKNIGDVDDNFGKRWDWVLEEMIWAFEQKVDENSDDQFYLDGFDKDRYDVWQKRKSNAFKLFGKYYENLWD
ncbi:hypothetical protein UFOVP245_184 [uncultured Caudovirales phage]|uniref:Uncharacterized protein n=1 Tax=uncultured Caudovirales phage TaxID=2100421 RepID=A0A6J7WUW6_9CAUD|nr:hypothetical protein UFOVP245_184 [uncultured Caudovirales phage]